MHISDIIDAKRRGQSHSGEEIASLIEGFVSGDVADYQMSAWLMAVCINGLNNEETVALTKAMISSGDTIDLSSVPGICVDKHSTGGVGDKTTLILVPLLASAGLVVAKMSGRGLGITGGTIDKLESIPGFNTTLTRDEFLNQARRIGCVLAGQSANLVPADKKLYALRDVTATVDCIPLIASSIMSKKIASGAGTILLDVKYGCGAFMKDVESARELADVMIGIGEGMGRRTIAAITNMDQPLGMAVGNAVEVAESIRTLAGDGPSDLTDLCLRLGSMLLSTATEVTEQEARLRLENLLSSGTALEKFREVIAAQGGNPRVVDDPNILPQARFSTTITAERAGHIESVDACIIGRVAGLLGAGRRKKDDIIDPTAGVILARKTGDEVATGDILATLLYSRDIDPAPIVPLAQQAFRIGTL